MRAVLISCLQGWLISFVLLSTAHAAPLDLSRYKGKVIYLDFWAPWCTPCRRSFPWLDGLARRYKQSDLVIIGVNVDHDHGLAERFLQDTTWVASARNMPWTGPCHSRRNEPTRRC